MLSIVLPSYFEEANVKYIYTQILAAVDDRDDLELIYVDDGSQDQTFEEVRALAKKDPRVRGIRLSRNFGQQAANLAGLNEAKGDEIVMMDADGQHPPALIPVMIRKLSEGYDIVNTKRTDMEGAGFFRKVFSRIFYRIINFLSDVNIDNSQVDFRIFNRATLNAFLEFNEHNRFNRGIFTWMGFNQAQIEFRAGHRNSGQSNYNFRKLTKLALDGITSFSTRPLRLCFYLGLIIIFSGMIYGIYAILNYFFGHTNPGWTSLLITILILGGVQLFSLGIIGEYLGRIFIETKKRPHYLIRERV
ncbi:MAG: glycosyltransferase family 2 protein [Bacteroidales bacterium]|nr:glycosyltransferase family 2 protein [Bacteroidales bacterium]MDT8432450.1 glycosyltransferase family 2 protein [Bacteroidales bacterium]